MTNKFKYWGAIISCCSPPSSSVFFHRSLRDPSLETNVEKWNDCACHILLWLKILLKDFNARDSRYITRKHTCIRLIPKKVTGTAMGLSRSLWTSRIFTLYVNIYQCFRTRKVAGVMFICWLSTGDRGPCFSRIWLWSQPFFHANLSICSGTLSAVWWDNCPAHPANFAVNTMRASGLPGVKSTTKRCFLLVQVLRQRRAQKETKLFQTITKTGERGTVAWLKVTSAEVPSRHFTGPMEAPLPRLHHAPVEVAVQWPSLPG